MAMIPEVINSFFCNPLLKTVGIPNSVLNVISGQFRVVVGTKYVWI